MLTIRPNLAFAPLAAAFLGFAAFFGTCAPARASDYGTTCAPTYHYETVTVNVCKTVPYTKCVTLYDQCGRPYQVVRTCYRTVEVPVRKCVKVYDR
jgi:hypothetical protein